MNREKLKKPDFTAWFVLQGLIAAMHQPGFQSERNEGALRLLLPIALEAKKARILSRLIHALPYTWQYKIGDAVTESGRLRHFYLRKQYIEQKLRHALAASDNTEVVVLGAGLDVLCLRLASEYPHIRFIEIDTQASQRFKTHALEARGIVIPENLLLVDGDLRNPLSQILSVVKNYDKNQKKIWIAEGVFMFIPEHHIARILQELRDHSGKNSSIIFTTLEGSAQSSLLAHLLQSFFLYTEKCPYKWTIAFEKVSSFIANLQLEMVDQIRYAELQSGVDSSKSDKKQRIGENIHVANF
jgi:methyltransferase (TIGR00027 family)